MKKFILFILFIFLSLPVFANDWITIDKETQIYKQSLKRNPKPYVIVGAKYKILNFAMRFLPLSLLIKFTEKIFGGHKKPKQEDVLIGKE